MRRVSSSPIEPGATVARTFRRSAYSRVPEGSSGGASNTTGLLDDDGAPTTPRAGDPLTNFRQLKLTKKFGSMRKRETADGDRPAMSAESAARAALALSALGALAMFPKDEPEEEDKSDDEGDDEDGEEEDEEVDKWLFRTDRLIIWVCIIISLAFSALGVLMQLLPEFHQALGKHVVHFRWLIFLGSCFPMYSLLRKTISWAFVRIEMHFYRDSLAYLTNLKRATISVVFTFTQLFLFHLVFDVIFCYYGKYVKVCNEPNYNMRSDWAQKWLLCAGIFCTASWIACMAAKLLSTHFYKSTHFKKFKDALEREYILHTLSMPKRKAIAQHRAEHHHVSFGAGQRTTLSPVPSSPTLNPSISQSLNTMEVQAELSDLQAEIQREMSEDNVLERMASDVSDGPFAMHTRERPDNKLSEEMIAAVPLPTIEESNIHEIIQDEDKLERLRTAVVVKTYSKLMSLYSVTPSQENQERMRRRVRAFSKALFKNISWTAGEGGGTREYVALEDFELFFEPTLDGRAQAKAAFSLFDTTSAVMTVFNERATIASALEDTDSIVQSLESGFAGGLHFLFITFYLLIWKIDLVAGFTTFSAIMVGLSFVFGNSIRIMFESLLFLFGEHPYDVGDFVAIDSLVYEVRKVRLLYTVMINFENRTVYFSSKELLEKRITNLSRSTSHCDMLFPEVDIGVASGAKQELKSRMEKFMKENPTEYQMPPVVILRGLTNQNLKVQLMIVFTYNFTPDNFDRIYDARDRMIQLISDTLAEFHGRGVQSTTAYLKNL